MLNLFFPRGFFQRTCSIHAQKKNTIHVPTPFWRPVYIGGFRDALLKCNIDTKISYIWKELHFPNHHFWYPFLPFRGVYLSLPETSFSLPVNALMPRCGTQCSMEAKTTCRVVFGDVTPSCGRKTITCPDETVGRSGKWREISTRWALRADLLRKGAYKMAEYKWVTGLVGGFNPLKNSSQPGNLPQIEVKIKMFEAIK